jgi:hypothetical protein
MHGMGLADKVRHGVVSRGTAALQRPNPGEWVATPGDYATLSNVYHLSDGTAQQGLPSSNLIVQPKGHALRSPEDPPAAKPYDCLDRPESHA